MSRDKIVEESLGLEDKIQKSYQGRLGGVYGIMSMSKRKLIFITEKGAFRKSYNLVLDLPYEKIDSLRTDGNFNLIIEDVEGLKRTFISSAPRISIVEKELREIMEQESSQDI